MVGARGGSHHVRVSTEGERVKPDRTNDGRRDEAGQAAMWLILTMAFLLVALGTTAYSRLVSATDEVSSLQTAADAAALAGAQAIARDAPQAIKDAVRNGGGIPCGLGRSEAQAFAARNGATVTGYCYYPVQDRIEVTVRSQAVLESGRQESATSASPSSTSGWDRASCRTHRSRPSPRRRPLPHPPRRRHRPPRPHRLRTTSSRRAGAARWSSTSPSREAGDHRASAGGS